MISIKLLKIELAEQKLLLDQKNAALREVIAYIEVEKDNIKKSVAANAEILLPLIQKVKVQGRSQVLLKLIKEGLESLVSSFGSKLSQDSLKLTCREIEICNMIKGGLSSKEIATALCLSAQTVDKHRKNIRRKIGLLNSPTNLVTHLKQLG